MIENKRYLAGLFFCHIATEKILNALVVKATNEHPPKTHDLERLVVIGQIKLDKEQMDFLSELEAFQFEGRYPENFPKQPNPKLTNNYYLETIKLNSWLKTKL